MAEATVLLKIKKNILSCYICSAELTDPIGLPCLHGFCFECLETWHQDSQDKTQVICPECKKTAPVPKEGIRGFPGHFLVQNLQETMDKKSTDPCEDTCLACGKKAEVHCIDCTKSLCKSCLNSHNLFTKDHHTVTIEELQSGQVTTEGRVCEVHGEQVRYYCETEDRQVCIDCVSLKTCPVEHERMTLKEAAKKQQDLISELKKKCADNKIKFQNAIRDNKVVLGTLNDSVKQTKTCIVNCKDQYKQQVDQVMDLEIDTVEKIHKDRIKEIEDKTQELVSQLGQMEEVEKQVSDFTLLNSDFSITYKYSSLSKKLNELSLAKPDTADKSLGYLAYETISTAVPHTGNLLQSERWRLINQFPTSGMYKLKGIAINQDGDICVTSFAKGVKVFSRDGKVKYSFMNDCIQITDVTVSHDNRYIIESGENYGLQFCTSEGRCLSCVTLRDTNNEKSYVNSVAIDANDRIIAALVQGNTISIHYADGSVISKFAVTLAPIRLAATSEGEIVCSFRGAFYDTNSLELMDYSGFNARVVPPPPEIKKWEPDYVCCRQGEIFVGNSGSGDSSGIFQYTSKGHYLGCVTTEVNNPKGIALSRDGMELFVVEYDDCQVKIFQRQ